MARPVTDQRPARDLRLVGGVSSAVAPSDGDLATRARRGDTDAFALLIGRYQAQFVRYARYMLGNREDAEEAVQDTFVRAYRGIGQCDPNRLSGWLYRILINRCRTAARRRLWWVRGAIDLDAAAGKMGREPADSGWRDELDRAVAGLPTKYREAFLLKHVDELSYQEMSGVTGASIPALKMRVSRACEQLRATLGESV
jgi:RNA polymerase sigma-70 factor (ECF subfamily)